MNTSWLKDLKDLSLRPRTSSVKTFKSYVDFDASDIKEAIGDDVHSQEQYNLEEPPVPYPSPSLLPGELVIAEAENVLKFNALSELNKGISGLLLCTNFKLSFLTAENFPTGLHQRNLLLAENDICLINIDSIYHVVSGKRKKVSIASLTGNIEILEIHCKDFRIYTFSFKFSPANQKAVISAILHHAFAARAHLLFAFDYREPISPFEKDTPHSLLFTRPSDWEAELRRCKCPGWRVTLGNEKFILCDNLPECFVVPSILLDVNLNKAAPYFAGHRVPTWSWGLPSGASIVRMAATDPGIADNRQQELMIEAVSRANPEHQNIRIFDLDNVCPSVKDIQSSFIRLKELCMPTTSQEFWETDSVYLSKLEATKWLHNVSACLSAALSVVEALKSNTTAILIESEGRDLNCIVSSIAQIILDTSYRRQSGFQMLIQKEWIALGHPFTERLRHTSGKESEESPVFLLFLDCVWQLMQQCPAVFEFSETYLTTIWDSCHISVFDTFLFSSHKNRQDAVCAYNSSNPFRLRSVWNWAKQFSKNDIKLFHNPLYILNRYKDTLVNRKSPLSLRPRSFSSVKDSRSSEQRPLVVGQGKVKPILWSEEEENLMKIDPWIPALSVWRQCYFRWIPLAHVLGGSPAVLFLNNMKVADEIDMLEKVLSSLSARSKQRPPSLHRRAASDDYTISADIIDLCHIQDGSRVVTSAFPYSPVAPCDWHSYQFVPSTSCLQISYSSDDDLDD